MKLHFSEEVLEISKDFIQEKKSILDFLSREEGIELHENYIEFKNFTGILELDEKYLIIPEKLAKKFNLLNNHRKPKENFDEIYLKKFNLFLEHILKELSKEKLLFTLSLAKFPVDEWRANESKIFKLLILLENKDTLINSIHLILSNLHRKLIEYETYKNLNEVNYLDESVLLDMISNPSKLYETEDGIIQDRYTPVEVLQHELEEIFDTLENRFIKHLLKEIGFTINEELKEFLNLYDLVKIRSEIEYCLQSDIFNEVEDLNYFPSNSQVLMKKAGYRELFQLYRYFHVSFVPKFAEDLDMAFSLKDMATLWEYYILIKLLKGLKEKFGGYKIVEDFREMKKGKAVYETVKFMFEKGLILHFQPTKRSYSGLEFRPDFLIEYEDKKYIFDAKFRIFEDNKKDILQNMHYYKDGLNTEFAIAVCFGDDNKGEFYFKKRDEINISFGDIINLIENNEYDGVGYVNLSLEDI